MALNVSRVAPVPPDKSSSDVHKLVVILTYGSYLRPGAARRR